MTAEEGDGMEQQATSGWAYRRAKECRSSLWDSRNGKEKMFYEQSIIRNSKHALSSRLAVLAGHPVSVQTAPAEKPRNPGKVRTAHLDLEAFFLYLANICPYLTF